MNIANPVGLEKYLGDSRVEATREVVKVIILEGAYKATKYLSDKLTVKATRKRFKGKFLKKAIDITLTIGPPNYEERENIKRAKKEAKGQPGWALPMAIKYPAKEEKK
jgi:hypothetical protein